jgi:hypothetical protein
MNALELRTQIQESIEQLPEEKLLVAADFLAYSAEKECGDATEELLKISGFQESFEKARKNVKKGKVISVDQLKRKY